MKTDRIRHLRRVNGRLIAERTRLQKQVGKLEDKLNSSGFKRGAKQRYCSTEGGLQLAARRVISNCGSYTLGLATGVDVHGTTVSRYEVLRTRRHGKLF